MESKEQWEIEQREIEAKKQRVFGMQIGLFRL